MASRAFPVDQLSVEERLELMGRLWDSLDPSAAAPLTPELSAELERREADADLDPEAGDAWPEIYAAQLRKLRP